MSVALAVLAAPHETTQPRRGVSFEHVRWTIQLPPGWKPTRETRTDGQSARFEDGKGGFFVVHECVAQAGIDRVSDADWTLRWDPPTMRYEIEKESRERCTREERRACEEAHRRGGDDDFGLCCPVGNGRFDVFAEPRGLDGPAAFSFGNERAEEGVDLAPFRALVRSFRSKRWPITDEARRRRGC
jgi:hypothetical protein